MKKSILIVALVLSVLAIGAVGVGVAFAQDINPPFAGYGPMMNGQGVLHTYMVTEFAKKLNLNVDDINARLAAGESMYDIALSAGITADDFPALMTEVRANALNAAVADGVISQEQADWMKAHGFGRGGMMGNGYGNCINNSDGSQFGKRGGMMGWGRGWQNQQSNP